ncbi:hypothetical protein [Kribbella sp. NBC_00359]|uniref:hypothetical protein n=1 Tax=Kribbella sp. NBC_00359 TaxID=2975966 RepID=UPI002E1F2CF0
MKARIVASRTLTEPNVPRRAGQAESPQSIARGIAVHHQAQLRIRVGLRDLPEEDQELLVPNAAA